MSCHPDSAISHDLLQPLSPPKPKSHITPCAVSHHEHDITLVQENNTCKKSKDATREKSPPLLNHLSM